MESLLYHNNNLNRLTSGESVAVYFSHTLGHITLLLLMAQINTLQHNIYRILNEDNNGADCEKTNGQLLICIYETNLYHRTLVPLVQLWNHSSTVTLGLGG